MSNELNAIQDKIRTQDIKNISTQDLIQFLYLTSNNNNLKNYDQNLIKKFLLKINYSFFYENIFANKQNYPYVSILLIGLLIPFYINYPRFYNLGIGGFLIGVSAFIGVYYYLRSLYIVFFPNVSRFFILCSILFYGIFFLLFNKLNHISLFFISCVISFLFINSISRIILTIPTETNTYNQLKVQFEDKKNYIEYNDVIEKACVEINNRFQLQLPSGKMLYNYLTVFTVTENKTKVIDFLSNIFSPIITLIYVNYLSDFFSSLKNKSYKNIDLQVLPIVGSTDKSKGYIDCQANYVLPIEYSYSQFMNQFYTENELDSVIYQKFKKATKRIHSELINIYQPVFQRVPVNTQNIEKHISFQKNITSDNNHILIQIKKLLIKFNINFNQEDSSNYLDKLLILINNPKIPYESKSEALTLLEKINQTLLVETTPGNKEEDVKLAIQVLLEDTTIDVKYKKLLKELCENYASYLRNNLNDKKLYGFNYNIWTYPIFTHKVVQNSNQVFHWILKLISTYVLLGRPLTSPWLLTTWTTLTKSNFAFYVRDMASNNSFMKYLGMGLDSHYFEENFTGLEKNNTILNKTGRILLKLFLTIFISLPFLQFFNSVLYGLTFQPLYMNLIYQAILIGHLFFCYFKEPLGLPLIVFTILYFVIIVAGFIIYYLVKNKVKN